MGTHRECDGCCGCLVACQAGTFPKTIDVTIAGVKTWHPRRSIFDCQQCDEINGTYTNIPFLLVDASPPGCCANAGYAPPFCVTGSDGFCAGNIFLAICFATEQVAGETKYVITVTFAVCSASEGEFGETAVFQKTYDSRIDCTGAFSFTFADLTSDVGTAYCDITGISISF